MSKYEIKKIRVIDKLIAKGRMDIAIQKILNLKGVDKKWTYN